MSPVNDSVVQNTVIISTAVSSQVQWINLYVDGNYIVSSPPYNFTWDSTKVANGSHTISIEAFSSSSGTRIEVGSDSITVDVENGTSTSTPTPTPKLTCYPNAYSDRANSDADTGKRDPDAYSDRADSDADIHSHVGGGRDQRRPAMARR